MNNSILKKAFRTMSAAALAAVCVASVTSCKEEEFTSRGDLFQPKYITAQEDIVVNNNDMRLAWYTVNDASGYTIRIYTDTYYQELFYEADLSESYITLTDLPYGTRFYVLVRSNAPDPQHNSQWAKIDFTTEIRPDYARIVQGVSRSDIEDDAVTIRWVTDNANPADSMSLKAPMDPTFTEITRYLTPEEQEAGEIHITDLKPTTLYTFNIYDTSKPRQHDKPYNEVNFSTTGPAAMTVQVGLLDDLSTMLTENNLDPGIPEGTEYVLPAGSTYTIQPFSIRKGFRIVGPADSSEGRPVVILNGTWSVASGSVINSFGLENIEVRNQLANQYFFNASGAYSLQSASFVNVIFRNIMRGFWRHQASTVKHVSEIVLDNCWFDQCGWQSGTYGTFHFQSAGKNELGQYDQIDNITIRNTTFSRGGSTQDAAFGWGNLISHNTTINPIELTVENVTFYDFCVGNALIDISNTSGSIVTVRNVIIASRMGDLYMQGSRPTNVFSNNYTTSEHVAGGNQIQAVALGMTAESLFQDPENGDYTIKDKSSAVYMTQAGDPRWIK